MPSAEVRCPICRLRVRVSSAQMMRIDPASKCQNKQGLDRLPEPEAGAGRGTAPIGRLKISRGIIGTESRRSTPHHRAGTRSRILRPVCKARRRGGDARAGYNAL
jgi:hypothetical protein